MKAKPVFESKAVKSAVVLPPDTNNLGTVFVNERNLCLLSKERFSTQNL
jgi:hypothetical protein